MPAPNIATLYDFETAYEDAMAAYFTNLNVSGYTLRQVITPRSNLTSANFLSTPRLQIRCGISGVGASGGGMQEGTATVANVAYPYYSTYQISVTLDVVTSRSNTAQPHGLYRGATRQGMLELTASMNANTVPYYQTAFVTPLASAQGIDADNDEITTQMSYQIDAFIPPASFPNA
jgi:hypothetical protein